MCRFAADGMAAQQRQHTYAQLKTGVDECGKDDDSERIEHIFIFRPTSKSFIA